MSSCCCAIIFTLIFSIWGYTHHRAVKEYSAGVIILIVLALICCLSVAYDSYKYYKIKGDINKGTQMKNSADDKQRPCYSSSKKIIIE